MGARGPGQIAHLAGIVSPSVGLVLNVGVAHLGEFGTRDGIAAAKGELVAALPSDGLAVLNADDPRVSAMAARTAAPVLTFGVAESSDVRLSDVGLDSDAHTTLRLTWQGRAADVTLRYVGEHQAINAAAAAAVAMGVGVDFDDVTEALRTAAPMSKWRMEISTNPNGVVVVNDAYNANPDSMRAALSTLGGLASRRGTTRTCAVLGEMLELGDTGPAEHAALGRLVAAQDVALLVTVGAGARPDARSGSRGALLDRHRGLRHRCRRRAGVPAGRGSRRRHRPCESIAGSRPRSAGGGTGRGVGAEHTKGR